MTLEGESILILMSTLALLCCAFAVVVCVYSLPQEPAIAPISLVASDVVFCVGLERSTVRVAIDNATSAPSCMHTTLPRPKVTTVEPLEYHLSAAGGEREGFQILLRANQNQSASVKLPELVAATLPRRDSRGSVPELSLEQIGYVWVTNATDPARTFSFPCAPEALEREGGCWVMDPLIPVTDNHVRVPANTTAGVLVTVTVPHNTPAGYYTGTIHITPAPARLTPAFTPALTPTLSPLAIAIDLTVRVFGFDLPVSATLKTATMLDAVHIHKSFPHASPEQMHELVMDYSRWMLAEKRLNPGSIYSTWSADYPHYNTPFLYTVPDLVSLAKLGLNFITLPHSPLNTTRAYVAEIAAHAADLAGVEFSFYGFDESNDFENMTRVFSELRVEFPNITTLTTAHIGTQYGEVVPDPVPFTAHELASLSVTAVCPQTNYIPPLANLTDARHGGAQIWTYTSMQPYKPKANLKLDNPLVDSRVLFWQIADMGFDGYLYWGWNQWSGYSRLTPIPTIDASTPPPTGTFADLPFLPLLEWNPQTTPDAGLAWLFGDGKLLYHGEMGPISSLRLDGVRDGMEDYDYLSLLHTHAPPDVYAKLLQQVSDGNIDHVMRDVGVVANTREAIGEYLESVMVGGAQ